MIRIPVSWTTMDGLSTHDVVFIGGVCTYACANFGVLVCVLFLSRYHLTKILI